jgi:hypothetical protein
MAKIQSDKEMHFWAGVTVGIFALILFKAVEAPYCPLLVSAAVLAAAFGKELKDLMDYGKFDWRDAVYTIAGGVIPFVLSFF